MGLGKVVVRTFIPWPSVACARESTSMPFCLACSSPFFRMFIKFSSERM